LNFWFLSIELKIYTTVTPRKQYPSAAFWNFRHREANS